MRRVKLHVLVLIACSVLGFSTLSAGDDVASGTVRMAFFYSSKSEESAVLIEDLVPMLRKIYPLEVWLCDVEDGNQYELLTALEKLYAVEVNDLPIAVVGNDVIAGADKIWENLESVVARYEAHGGCEFPRLPEEDQGDAGVLSHPVYVVSFHKDGCVGCKRVRFLLDRLRHQYRGLVVKEVDIETAEGKLLNESLSERVGVIEKERLTAPSVFFSQEVLVGEAITAQALERMVEKYAALEEMSPFWELPEEEQERAEGRIVERFKALGLSTVVAAGLLDGLNPCAFATLIFFLSYLAFMGRDRREIAWVGVAFAFSVFVTYFLLGLGLLRVIQSVSVMPIVGRCVYGVAIALAVVFGGLSLYDYVLCRRGRVSSMVLQMPGFLKKRVHGVIRREARGRRYVIAALATGFVVSVLELACTGQVYLPTILFVSKADAFRASAIGYLAIYNLMFIVPLLVVFGLVSYGTGSDRLTVWFQTHLPWVKLATSVFFFVLASALSVSFI